MDTFNSEELTRKAAEYRKANSRLKGGVIVFHQGEIRGWVNALRDPHHWQPECVAIDEQGNLFIALGGNDRDGAERWQLVPPATEPEIDGPETIEELAFSAHKDCLIGLMRALSHLGRNIYHHERQGAPLGHDRLGLSSRQYAALFKHGAEWERAFGNSDKDMTEGEYEEALFDMPSLQSPVINYMRIGDFW